MFLLTGKVMLALLYIKQLRPSSCQMIVFSNSNELLALSCSLSCYSIVNSKVCIEAMVFMYALPKHIPFLFSALSPGKNTLSIKFFSVHLYNSEMEVYPESSQCLDQKHINLFYYISLS